MDTNNTNNMESKELLQSGLETLRAKQGFICDMDGVIYHGNRLLPGVKEFVDWLYRENKHFLFLTNSSERSPKELQQKLARMGLDVDESHFYTSALATARFISSQAPGCSAYVIGGAGLIMALHDEGITGRTRSLRPGILRSGAGRSFCVFLMQPIPVMRGLAVCVLSKNPRRRQVPAIQKEVSLWSSSRRFWSNFIPPAFQTPTGFSAVTRRIGTVLTDSYSGPGRRGRSLCA